MHLPYSYPRKERLIVKMLFNVGEEGQGHGGVVHGGLVCVVMDNIFGYMS
jgi:acyl-coenzyme A thioesterase PaaI-like protein